MPLPSAYRKNRPRNSMDVRTGELEGLDGPDPIIPASAFPTTIDPNYVPDDKTTAAPVPSSRLPPAVDPLVLPQRPIEPVTVTPEPTPSLADMEAPPIMMTHDKRGRPKQAIGGADSQARRQAEAEAADDYVPQKEPKWRRFLRGAGLLASAFGGAIGHDPETVARATGGLIETAGNPRTADERWKAGRQAETYGRRKADATITNLENVSKYKDIAQQQRQQGIDIRGQRVSDVRIKEALAYLNKIDYTPGVNKALDDYFAGSGLHNLPPHKKDDTNQLVWEGGRLLTVGKRSGEATAVTEGPDGPAVVDESKVPSKSVTIGDQTFDNLTPREAATLEGREFEGVQNRKSREKIAAGSQAGQDRRKAAEISSRGSNANAVNPSVKGSIAALSKFRTLTARIESRKAYWAKDKAGDAEIQSLYDQRDGLERDMKQLYGQYLELDSNGKPKGLKESAYTPTAGANDVGPTIQGAIDHFKVRNKRAPNADEIKKMQSQIDALR